MSTEGAWETKSFWTVKTAVITGAIALAVALVPAVAQGETVTPHAVTPHVVTPHVVSPPAPADPAPSPAPSPDPTPSSEPAPSPEPAPSSEPAPSPEPAPAPSPSAAESPSTASGPAPAPDPQAGQPSAPGGPIASDNCVPTPWRVCVEQDEWTRYPDSVTYFVFTRLICPYWTKILAADQEQGHNAVEAGNLAAVQTLQFIGALEHARQMSDRYCITSVIP